MLLSMHNKKIPIVCPCSLKYQLTKQGDLLLCSFKNCEHNNADSAFKIQNSIPILFSEIRTDTVCSLNKINDYVERPFSKYTKLKKWFLGESDITKKNCHKFVNELFKISNLPKVLLVGGGEKGSGTNSLWDNESIEIHSIDIYFSENVDILCDAHYLPLQNDYYDGVWIQAVLEHVVDPSRVVEEINRVLKEQGVVYSETPFMQQVHEGPYDFTRYTVLGHRYLFKKFQQIEIGANGGANLVLAWSIRYFFWALIRNRNIARVFGIIFTLILTPFERFISTKSLYDSSSGVYFMGRKSDAKILTHKELISLYKGQF
jgi:SAM-dependent methyltransferase